MRVVVTTGIFPPDIGGPATHAANLADELRRRGHDVVVLTLTDGPTGTRANGLVRWPRRWPWPARCAAVISWLVRNRRRYDVIYAAGLHLPAVFGARLARRPVVAKIVADPAWERALRLGTDVDDFETYQQTAPKSRRDRLMRALRDWTVKRASAVTVPSEALAGVVRTWQSGGGRGVCRIPNGVLVPAGMAEPKKTSSERFDAVFVGRLIALKRVDLLLEAVALCDGVHLTVVGDGPERERLVALAADLAVADRAHFLGALPHEEVLAELAQAHVLLMASEHEGLPHVALEALVMGTPVVASPAGGTTEVIVDGENGRLVDPASPEAFATVLAELRDVPELLDHLAAGALASAASWRFEGCADAIEGLLSELSTSAKPPRRPRLIILGKGQKGWLGDPPSASWKRKFEVISRHFDATFLAADPLGTRCLHGVRVVGLPSLRPRLLGGAFFYAFAPVIAAAMAVARAGTVVLCQSPYDAYGLLLLRRLIPGRRRPRVVVEVHGDWRTASRLYGSGWRRVLSPAADRMAVWSIRHADRVRPVGPSMQRLVQNAGYQGSIDPYVAFVDFTKFSSCRSTPLPGEPRALFIGVLERYKAPEVLLDAWRTVSETLPDATLSIVGQGALGNALRAQVMSLGLDDSVQFLGSVPHEQIADLLDSSTCLVLPSRSEGLPRVALEAMSRGRPIVGSTGGGIPDVIEDGINGRLVPPEHSSALAHALIEVLSEGSRATAMGEEGRRRFEAWDPAGEFEAGVQRLAAWASES